mmetsp:Transcript_67957/g.148028  ORF Transcript_67957/g.148028 Transcript_67957/m.148028 type:complete len:252 (+) Transcript_67957:1388-2143(+)
MDHPVLVLLRDLHGRVPLRCGRATDHERDLETPLFHLLCNKDHFVQRRGDEARQSNDVHVLLLRLIKDVLAWHHDAHVNHPVVVASEHDADNVLANVVHVTLYRSHQHRSVVLRLVGVFACCQGCNSLLLLHERDQHSHGLLHHTSTLDHLRQEHFASTKEIADDAHAAHEWALNDLERNLHVLTSLLYICLDEFIDSVDEAVMQTLNIRAAAPRIFRGTSCCRSSAARSLGRVLHLLGECQEALNVIPVL